MKCIHCYREIEDGLKFCTKCGFQQPEDREAYEREHPELAEAIPEDEMLERIEQVKVEKSTAMSYDDLVQLLSPDPHCDDILMMVNEGLVFFSITHDQEAAWYSKCANLISDKIGFYPFFMQCLNQGYEKARSLLYNQARENWSVMPITPEQKAQADDNLDLPPQLPPQLPKAPFVQPQPIVPPVPAIQPQHPFQPQPAIQPQPVFQQQPAADFNNTYTPAYTSPTPTPTKNCPFCNTVIPADSDMCPFCHAALDYSYTQNDDTQDDETEKKKSHIWILPVTLIGLLIVGLIIYAFVPKGPTGDPQEDAEQTIKEVINILSRDINSEEDIQQVEDDLTELKDKYEDFYKDESYSDYKEYQEDLYEYTYNNDDLTNALDDYHQRIKEIRYNVD